MKFLVRYISKFIIWLDPSLKDKLNEIINTHDKYVDDLDKKSDEILK